MSNLTKDDIRAAVAAGILTEAQAASTLALSDSRRGARENLEGLDEPFELFKGFNEIFIVIGLSILAAGYVGLAGSALFGEAPISRMIAAGVALGAVALLSRYFVLIRRMIAPAIALTLMAGLSALQLSFGLLGVADTSMGSLAEHLALTAGMLLIYWHVFRVPFALFLIAGAVFGAAFSFTAQTGREVEGFSDFFLLTQSGPFPLITLGLGLTALVVALGFDLSDPHRVTRRASNAFWLHVIAAPAIVNTIALSLFDLGGSGGQWAVFAFVLLMAAFAIIIDRRSFLISGVGYAVALGISVMGDAAALGIFGLGLLLILLGAYWEVLRGATMRALPDFPAKDRLPPYSTGAVSE